MKIEHIEILSEIERHLETPGAEHLRFWQALFNMNIVKFKENSEPNGNYQIENNYNISDTTLLKRIRGWGKDS